MSAIISHDVGSLSLWHTVHARTIHVHVHVNVRATCTLHVHVLSKSSAIEDALKHESGFETV